MQNDTYCVLPFISIATDTQGDIVPCCMFSEKITKTDGTPYNLGKDSLTDIRNSLNDIKNKMLRGEKVSGCETCYKAEMNGGTSYRQTASKKHKISTNVTHTDIRFGNTCNLSCRSCHPIASSSLANEFNDLHNRGHTEFQYTFYAPTQQWYTTDVFEENIQELLKTVTYVYLTGGESTLIKKNIWILEQLVESNRANEVTIEVSSNVSIYNPKFYDMLPSFKQVLFQISVDGFGRLQEYMRYPSDWRKIDDTINRLLALGSNIVLIATPVIQIYNLNKLTDLYSYFESKNQELNRQAIYLSGIDLTEPSYLDIVYLPTYYKKECYERLITWKNEYMKSNDIALDGVIKIIEAKSLQEVDYTENLSKFTRYTELLDKNRNMKLEDYNIELSDLLRKINQ